MIDYKINRVDFNEYRCDAIENNNIIASGFFYIQNNEALGKYFKHSSDTLDLNIAKGIVDNALNYLRNLGIPYLIVPPAQNKNILLMLSEFNNVRFFNRYNEIDINIIKNFDCQSKSFLCNTTPQDLLHIEDRITTYIYIKQ